MRSPRHSGKCLAEDTTELLEETKMLLQPLGAFCKDYSLRLEGHIETWHSRDDFFRHIKTYYLNRIAE